MDIKELSNIAELIDSDLTLSFKADINKRLTYLKLAMKSYMVNADYDSSLYDLDRDELFNGYQVKSYDYIEQVITAKMPNRSVEDKERYNEYLLLLLTLESLERNKCKQALRLYKDASLCGTNLKPIQIKTRKEKRLFANVARTVWSYDVSNILMPAHVARIVKKLTGINRNEETLKDWLRDEMVTPLKVLEAIADNNMPRGDAVDEHRAKLTALIYDELKNNCNEV